MRHTHVVLSLSIALLAAGCLGAKEAPVAETETGSATEQEGDTLDAAAATGNATWAADEATAMAPAPFAYSGSTPEGVCGPVGCEFVTPGAEDFHPLEVVGAPTSLTVTYTYAGLRPGMEFYVGLCVGAGADESESSCDGYTTGPSPLTVTFDLTGVPAGSALALSTGALNGASTATGVVVFTSSSFDAEGALAYA